MGTAGLMAVQDPVELWLPVPPTPQLSVLPEPVIDTVEGPAGSLRLTAASVPLPIKWPQASTAEVPVAARPEAAPAEVPPAAWPEAAPAGVPVAGAVPGRALGATRRALYAPLVVFSALAFGIVAEFVFVGGLQHRAAQQSLYQRFRKELAEGTAPVGQTVAPGSTQLLALGAPVALLEIPSIGLKQVVLEGTTSGVLADGPGHNRTSPLPGQAGISVILGRQAAYGGPFGDLHRLRTGQRIVVVTGEGTSMFKVLDVRHAGQLAPAALASGKARLQLETGDGRPFMPSGVIRVDADQTSPVLAGTPSALPATAVLPSEKPMAGDTSTLWQLVLWMQALVLVAVGAVWSWHRWGRYQTWIAFIPPTILVGLFAADQFMKILPNML